MNWIFAVIIGVVIGGVGGLVLGRQNPRARWLAPVLSLVGTLIAAGLGAALGHAGYGWKKATLQVVLALVGVGLTAVLVRREASADSPPPPRRIGS